MSPRKNLGQQLLAAHLEFELERWTGDTTADDLEALLAVLHGWAERTALEQIIDADTAVDTILRWVDDWYLPDTITVLIGALVKRLIHLPINQDTTLEQLIDDDLVQAGVDLLVDMEGLRESLISQATESPLYGMLISNVLYSGIRDYLSGEGGVTQKVPGMSALLSKGSAALNKRMPGLEAAIEERLRKYIAANAQKSIRGSRKFLMDSLNAEQIRQLADEIWHNAKQSHLSISELISDEEIDRIASFGLAVWQDLRQTEYIQELIREAIYGFYDGYGSESISVLLDHLGLGQELILKEVREVLPPLLVNLRESGLLEPLLEARLRAFYESETCRALLA